MNILRYAFKNIFRNLFLSISSIMTIGLLVFFVNILLLVVHSSGEFISSVNDKIVLNINFKAGYNDSQIRSKEFLDWLKNSFSTLEVKYISREEAFAIFSERNPDLASVIEDSSENPLPDSVQISQIPIKSYNDVHNYIATFEDILQYNEDDLNKKLLNYEAQYNRVLKIVDLLNLLNKGIYILIGLFIFTASIMIHTVIRNFVFFLQDEVRIIELVGWKPSFIYWPLMVQGVVYTVLSTIGAVLLFVFFVKFGWISYIPENIANIFMWFYDKLINNFFLQEIWIAILVGIVSAFLASYKYIHSTIWEK